MVENSLGRLWVEGHPNDELKAQWKYYLEEAEQEPEVQRQLEEIRKEYAGLNPEDIRCIDPCMGSGHILCYMFDVLVQIYEAHGVQTRDAVRSIVENNLYGLDIDDRAAQLAYFSVMMKGRQYDSRFFKRRVQPNVYSPKGYEEGKEFGALLTVDELENMPQEPEEYTLFDENFEEKMNRWQFRRVLAQKYDVVCTNPPYMGAGNMNGSLSEFIKSNFADYKSDFFSVFMVRCMQITKSTGYLGFFTPYVWMFIQSYEKLRRIIYNQKTIETLIQFEYSAFEEATVPVCTFVFRNCHVNKKGCFFRLTDFRGGMEVQRQKTLEAISNHSCGYFYEISSENFSKIPGSPVAYWVGESIFYLYSNKCFSAYVDCKSGIMTGSDKYIRLWFEPIIDNIKLDCKSYSDMGDYQWFPLNSGGGYRKWYGNNQKIVDLYHDGIHIQQNVKNYRLRNKKYYFKKGITWGRITSSEIAFREVVDGSLFGDAGPIGFIEDKREYVLGLLNSSIVKYLLNIKNPTMNFQIHDIMELPLIVSKDWMCIEKIVGACINSSKEDWDSLETSWGFKHHPLA